MKILISRLSWQRKSIGGAEISAFQHASSLERLGCEVTLASNIKLNIYPSSIYIPLPGQRHLQLLLSLLVLPVFLLKKYDVINPHSRADQIIFTLLKPVHRSRVIWKDPGDLIQQIKLERKGLFEQLNQRLLVYAVLRADHIYTLNNRDKRIIIERLGILGSILDADRISVIPTSIDFDDYNLSEAGLEKSKLVIGTVGRIDTHHKGLDNLIKALAKVKSNNYELWVIGDGPDLSKLKTIANESGLPIKFLGYKKELSKYYTSMDIFIQPSRSEGFGRTVKEAMYFSLPVIGSDVGGIPDQIDDGINGLLYKPEDTDTLAKNIDTLLSDEPLRLKLGTKAHRKAVIDGDIHKIIHKRVLPLFKRFVVLK
jgi:glycosyltransferase involved in cell wall biosynthesis